MGDALVDARRTIAREVHAAADRTLDDCYMRPACCVCRAVAEELRTVAYGLAQTAIQREASR